MRQVLQSAALLFMLALASSAQAQPARTVVADEVEAIVTVNEVDPQARTVTVTGPRGERRTLHDS